MSVRAQLSVVGAAQIVKVLLYSAGVVVLSRLLEPRDFGLMALSLSILGFGELVRDLGLSLAVIQAPTVSKGERANLFWVNVGVGIGLYGLALLIAPLVADLVRQPATAHVIAVSALTFVLNGASAQYRAQSVREGRFTRLAVIDIASQGSALGVASGAALAGFGVWALVQQQLVQAGLGLLLVVAFARWVPGWPRRHVSIRRFVGFGFNLLGVQALTYVSRNLDNLLIGATQGPSQLGFYSRAYQLYSQPQQQIIAPFTNLAVRTLSDPARVNRWANDIHRFQLIMNYTTFFLYGLLIGAALPVVEVLLGDQWSPAVSLLQILALGGVFQLLGYIYYWVFLSRGLTALHLRCVLISQPIALAALLIGLPWGTTGVAWGSAVGMFVEWLIPATYGARKAGMNPVTALRVAARPLLLGALAASASAAAVQLTFEMTFGLRLVIAVLAGTAVWFVVALLWRAARDEVADVAGGGRLSRSISAFDRRRRGPRHG